jgi:hypothetical protein
MMLPRARRILKNILCCWKCFSARFPLTLPTVSSFPFHLQAVICTLGATSRVFQSYLQLRRGETLCNYQDGHFQQEECSTTTISGKYLSAGVIMARKKR